MPSYVIITPVRNEGPHFHQTIDSVLSQTIRPQAWVIVDDGSTDITPQLADAAAARHPWIFAIHRTDRGFRKQGGGVIEAFYDGYAQLSTPNNLATPGLHHSTTPSLRDPITPGLYHSRTPSLQDPITPGPHYSSTPVLHDPIPAWAFLIKLDGDLSFSADYFEQCFKRFAADPQLGIGGGRVYCRVNGATVEDSPGDPAFHVRGATKIYRRATWDAIGGLVRAPGWDTLDEVKANMLGWKTCSFHDLRLVQLKPTGSADGSWKNWVKNGRANYITGYHPLFMLLKCLKRVFQKPYGVAGLGLLSGFSAAYLGRLSQVPDPDLICYLRRQQMNRLLGKQSLWTPSH
jgi:glycosyltransferase involved in cell wall biosynthesis